MYKSTHAKLLYRYAAALAHMPHYSCIIHISCSTLVPGKPIPLGPNTYLFGHLTAPRLQLKLWLLGCYCKRFGMIMPSCGMDATSTVSGAVLYVYQPRTVTKYICSGMSPLSSLFL